MTSSSTMHERSGLYLLLKLWRFLSSIRLGLILILIIGILALVSIFLIQVPDGISTNTNEYVNWLNNVVRPDLSIWTDTLSFFGLFDIFHSPLFFLVGSLLMVNIACCTINRWSGIIRAVRKPSVKTDAVYYADSEYSYRTTAPGGATALLMANSLLQHGYRVRSEDSNNVTFIAADKFASARLGTVFSHISLLLLILGFLISSNFGFNDDSFVVAEGTVRDVGHDTGLSLGLLSFEVEYWDDGTPKEYRSEVSVYQDGQPTDAALIRVNHPLNYSGVRFYQSFFGPAAVMNVRTSEGAEVTSRTVSLVGIMEVDPFLRPIGKLELPDTGLTAYIVASAVNIDDPILQSDQIGIELYEDEVDVPINWVILDVGTSAVLNDLEFNYERQAFFSGFSVKHDPGRWLIWLAFGLFLLGTVSVLYFPREQVYIMIQPIDGGSSVSLRCSGRHGFSGRMEIDKLIEEDVSHLSGKTYNDQKGMDDA